MKPIFQNSITLFILLIFGLYNISIAQNVTIPDANFKALLVSDNRINTNADGEIQVGEAAVFTATINAESKSISDLTGIEAFTSLSGLNCSSNQLNSLNVSKNIALTRLDCFKNHFKSLNLSSNLFLTILNCQLNELTSLDVSRLSALRYLNCGNNILTSLALITNTALIDLDCSYNQLTNLNVSSNSHLRGLDCSHNFLTSLDLSPNKELGYLYCGMNQLKSLNIKIGKPNMFTQLVATSNYDLKCIQVDDPARSIELWDLHIDALASLNESCTVGIINLSWEADIHIFPNPSDGFITVSGLPLDILSVDIYNLLGEKVCSNIKRTNQTTYNIEIANSPKGIYLVNMYNGKKVLSKKIEIR